jgi:hypothetical protein
MLIGLIVADLVMAAAFGISYFRLPPQIPLFYSRPWGEDQLTDLWLIAILPVLMHVFYFTNSFIADRFLARNRFPYQLMRAFNWFLVITITGIFLRIMLLVT